MQGYQPKSHYEVHRKDPDHIIFEQCLEPERNGNCSPILQYQHLLHSSDITKYQFMIEHKNVSTSIKSKSSFKKLKSTNGEINSKT